MLLTLTTTHQPATDLGYLLVKHPQRVHSFELAQGRATVVYPEADDQRCTAALIFEVDPGRLASAPGDAGSYVNDRPYAASSLLAAALNRVFRTAARGHSADRPELAASPIPLTVGLPCLRCKGGMELTERLFAPLGWQVSGSSFSRYVDLTLTGELRLADALNHLYVLLPVLDDAKHYWVAPDEVGKLLSKGEGWLAAHPERRLIIRRYLAHSKPLTRQAEALLEPEGESDSVDEAAASAGQERPRPLAAVRREAVLGLLAEVGAQRVLDLGCGPGALLGELIRQPRFTEIVGADVSARSLELAERRLHLSRLPDRQRARIKLVQSALTYADERLKGYDAAVLMEVIEHLDEPRLPALAQAVFGFAAPAHVIMTTPNAEYNVRYPGLESGRFRHPDHRFEWTRAQFQAWASEVAGRFGYAVGFRGVGVADPVSGTSTQLAHFRREATAR